MSNDEPGLEDPTPPARLWLRGFWIAVLATYVLVFAVGLPRVGRKDHDQQIVFHEIQCWNQAYFGLDRQWTPVLCGGISNGKRDFVRPVIEQVAGPPAFHGVAQRPGKPLAFWRPNNTPLIAALPGNPMSVLTCFHRYMRPLLDRLAGQSPLVRTVQLTEAVSFPPPFAWLLPVALRQDGANLLADPCPLANSGDFASSIGTDGFLELPGETTDFPEGFLAPYHEWI